MTTVERVIKICKERNIPISKIERDCGFSNGYLKGLKRGDLTYEKLIKVADYLNESPEWLAMGNLLLVDDHVGDDLLFLTELQEKDPEYIHNLVLFVRRTYRDEEGEIA